MLVDEEMLAARQYETVARAIAYIREHTRRQPSLRELSEHLGLSEFYLQRTFSQWAGVSPKRFLQYLTKEYAKTALKKSQDILSTSMDAGLSSPGRLHDLMVACEAMSPGEVKALGAGLVIRYGVRPTVFGHTLIASTERGICHIAFLHEGEEEPALSTLENDWPAAAIVRDEALAARQAIAIFGEERRQEPLRLLLRGTNFQIKVWEALLRVAPGERISYSQLADVIGIPTATRAVASAIAENVIAFLIPCHRVIRDTGESGKYRWGSDRKIALLAWEAAHSEKKR